MACSSTLYAGSGWDWSSLFIVQNGHRGYPAGGYVTLVDFRSGNDRVAMLGGAWKYAGKSRTN